MSTKKRKPAPKFQLQFDHARIPELARQYLAQRYQGGTNADADRAMENAGERIVSGLQSATNTELRQQADLIYDWKSPRRKDLFLKNSDQAVADALREAASAKSVRKALAALTELDGVGVKMASAVLTALSPQRYTVLDFRALEAMGANRNADGIRLYVYYLRACRRMARNFGVQLRDLDRANWQFSKMGISTECCGAIGVAA